jgi:hypothetical protein
MVDIDDRVLAHLQIVIGAKLRRGESFYLSWRDDVSVGNGNSALWIHPAMPLIYKYYASRMPRINRQWIDELTAAANSPHGLRITSEPEPDTSTTDDATMVEAQVTRP